MCEEIGSEIQFLHNNIGKIEKRKIIIEEMSGKEEKRNKRKNIKEKRKK